MEFQLSGTVSVGVFSEDVLTQAGGEGLPILRILEEVGHLQQIGWQPRIEDLNRQSSKIFDISGDQHQIMF
jgi:hypothetical protein